MTEDDEEDEQEGGRLQRREAYVGGKLGDNAEDGDETRRRRRRATGAGGSPGVETRRSTRIRLRVLQAPTADAATKVIRQISGSEGSICAKRLISAGSRNET